MPIAAPTPQPSPDAATDWRDLERELDAWAAEGRTATFWWRDDDAVAATPALDRLLDLADALNTPLGLAVIPASAEVSLPRRLEREPWAVVLQHGFAHHNHAPPGEPKAEIGRHRPPAAAIRELTAGRARLHELFGDPGAGEMLPVLVPPWNRIDPRLVPRLPAIGIVGLSTFSARPPAAPGGPHQVNTHLDLLNWDARRGHEPAPFVGTSAALDDVIEHLADRRLGRADADEPTGLLTHHLVLDAACWAFTEALIGRVAGHPAGRWLHPREAFAGMPTEAAA